MEIKGKIKEISVDERQAKVVLEDGMIISSNQPIQMETVRQFSEGDNIMADVFSSPGKPGTKWERYKFWNINSIELVIDVKDELRGSEKPVETKATVDEGTTMPETKEEQDEALGDNPEYKIMEMGKMFIDLINLYKKYDQDYKK